MTTMANIKPCPHRDMCGGCKFNGMEYDTVLKEKEDLVRSFLYEKNINTDVFQGIVPCNPNNRFAYRNKMEYTFGDMVKGGEMTLGMHKLGHFMSIVTVDECQLVPGDFNKILRAVLNFAVKNGYAHYNKKSHIGLLRNLIVRKGVRTDELLVNIVTTSEDGFDETGFVQMIEALPLESKVVGILRTFNDGLADAVYCDSLKILSGRDHYFEEICGLRFKVSAFAFFQTNVVAIERLYTDAVALLGDISGKHVFDLYCGTGTISQIISKNANKVTGVELVPESVESAKANAALNNIENCEFICGDVFKTLSTSIEEENIRPDAIIVDPPRMGMQTKAVSKIASYGVDQIVYVSCNPKTLAIDLAQFETLGYKVEYIKAYDNFAWTKHTECIVKLTRSGLS